MPNKSIDWFPVLVAFTILVIITIPFVYAHNAGGDQYVFGGLLLNPLDGFTYLAKMYQGWQGSWRNQMAYTADPGEGVYINLYYLFLGHVARFLGAPLILVYHDARLVGSALLFWMIWRFFGYIFADRRKQRLAFALAALGSGMGWIMIPFGQITSDLWVAEIYPFLSCFTNPHFPLGLTMLLWLILPNDKVPQWVQVLSRLAIAFLLSVVSPFGLVVVITVLGGHLVYLFFVERAWKELRILREAFFRIFQISIAGAPLMFYYLWIAANDPIVSVWNAQNLTLSPPVWDLLISLTPALLLAGVGVWAFFKRFPSNHVDHVQAKLVIWLVLGLILAYLPFGLQRRFLTGLFVPLAGLSALGIERLCVTRPKSLLGENAQAGFVPEPNTVRNPVQADIPINMSSYRWWVILFFVLVIPTNLVMLMVGLHGANTRDANLYLLVDEARALDWIDSNTGSDTLVLSSPDLGIFIPAFTGRGVIYGHPYETLYAEREMKYVENIYSDRYESMERQTILAERGVDLILCGPREQELANCSDWDYDVAYSQGQVLVFSIGR